MNSGSVIEPPRNEMAKPELVAVPRLLPEVVSSQATPNPAKPKGELTKLFEECRTGSPEDLAAHYAAHPPKGEIVLLVGPPGKVEPDGAQSDALLNRALETLKPSQAASQVAKATGVDRKALYSRALELRRE